MKILPHLRDQPAGEIGTFDRASVSHLNSLYGERLDNFHQRALWGQATGVAHKVPYRLPEFRAGTPARGFLNHAGPRVLGRTV